jgi:DNA-binding transcriptional LysR family regulator
MSTPINIFSKNGLSLDRLVNFSRVAECGSIKEAAGDDPNRQSLISRQIKELEAFFGVPLFNRIGRTLQITEAGEKLNILVLEYSNALEEFHEWCGEGNLELSIGAGDALIQWHLIPRVEAICGFLKCKRVSFQNLKTTQIVDKVRKGQLYFGVVRREGCPSDLKSISLGMLEYSAFIPSDLKVKRGADLASLLSENKLVGMEGEGTYSRKMNSLSQRLGSFHSYKILCASFPEMAKVLRHQRLVGIMPEIAKGDIIAHGYEAIGFSELKHFRTEMVLFWNQRFNRQVLLPEIDKVKLKALFGLQQSKKENI